MIGAVVVLFEPNIEEVCQVINQVSKQVDKVIIVDNSPLKTNFKNGLIEINDDEIDSHSHFDFIHFASNIGIAAAHNTGLNVLIEQGFEYALLLDQDSHVDDNLVFNLSSLLQAPAYIKHPLAAIGPQIYCAFSEQKVLPKVQREIFDYDELAITTQIIASGMLINLFVINTVGLKNEHLFIDGVDHEWCWRAKSKGFFIAKAKNVSMIHKNGDKRSKFLGVTYKVGQPIRLYYQFRNVLLLSRLSYVPIYWKVRCIIKLPIRLAINSTMQANRYSRLCFMLKGLVDGILNRRGDYQQNWKK